MHAAGHTHTVGIGHLTCKQCSRMCPVASAAERGTCCCLFLNQRAMPDTAHAATQQVVANLPRRARSIKKQPKHALGRRRSCAESVLTHS